MVRPSNPKLMAKVLEAVTNLSESKGSLTRDILKFVKQNSAGSPRNLTMQVQRALKHAVNAGLLGCKSGRYKMQLELNKVSHRRRNEDTTDYKNDDVGHEMSDESPAGGVDLSRKVQDRQKSSRMKRSMQKARKRSRVRGTKKKMSRRRGATMAKRPRKMAKPSRRKTNNAGERTETWAARKRRMMAKPKFEDEEDDDYEDNEDDEEEREEEHIREPRRMPKMKSVNEDRYSDISGDSVAVGRHRSRRSKHLAKERRSPSRRGNGDGESHRKTSRRSRSRRRRSQPRQRENRQVPAAEEPTEDQGPEMNEERNNELMDMDDDQADAEKTGTPPENQANE